VQPRAHAELQLVLRSGNAQADTETAGDTMPSRVSSFNAATLCIYCGTHGL